jgi:hypothetical protein
MPRRLLDADVAEPTEDEARVLRGLERDRSILLLTFFAT